MACGFPACWVCHVGALGCGVEGGPGHHIASSLHESAHQTPSENVMHGAAFTPNVAASTHHAAQVVGADATAASALADQLVGAVAADLIRVDEAGLARPIVH